MQQCTAVTGPGENSSLPVARIRWHRTTPCPVQLKVAKSRVRVAGDLARFRFRLQVPAGIGLGDRVACVVSVIDWLLEGDPAIRWQALRDLTNAPASDVAAERARVEYDGWGARLLALEDPGGLWDGGACFPASSTRR